MSGMKSENGTLLLESLREPGRLLVFVDDSGTHGNPMPGILAGDFECLCGIEMTSEGYIQATQQAARTIHGIPRGIEEFHAKDIINMTSRSPWNGVSAAERAVVLGALFSCVETAATRIYRGFYSGEQMRHTLEMTAMPELMKRGPKKAVETVFRNWVLPTCSGRPYRP